jgi:Zn-dependent peptidase ImmA (M78 family)
MSTKAPIVGATLQGIRLDLRMREDQLVPSCARKVEAVQDWEAGAKMPSDRQVEKLSRALRTPYAAFFTDRIPQIKRPRDRRAYFDRMGTDFSTETLFAFKTAAEMQFHFDYIQGLQPTDFPRRLGRLTLDDDPLRAGIGFRQQIGLTRKKQMLWKADSAYRTWRRIIESFGVLTMQIDLEADQLRGFCFRQPWPLVCVNSKDNDNGRSFSLLHEIAHIMLGEDSASGYTFEYAAPIEEHERFCNRFANGAILPHDNDFFQLDLRKFEQAVTASSVVDLLAKIAKKYRVSRHVILSALREHGRIGDDLASGAYAILRGSAGRQAKKSPSKGPLPHIKEISRRGELFSSAVMTAYSNGTVSASEAASFMNLKPRWLRSTTARLTGPRETP